MYVRPVGHLRAGVGSKKDPSRGDMDMPCSREMKQKGLHMLTISEGAGQSGNSVPPATSSRKGRGSSGDVRAHGPIATPASSSWFSP